MKNSLAALRVCAVAACALGLPGAFAQEPAEQIRIGFEQRVRNEDWNNIFDMSSRLDDEREQIRYRTRLWADVPLPFHMTVHAGVAQETNQKLGKDNAFDEVYFDAAYLEFHRLFTPRLSLSVGRQNLTRGEGLLFVEGTPQDGSRSLYVNAFDLAYTQGGSRVEVIGILDPKRDRFLPRINDRNRLLVDWDEQALGAYWTQKAGANSTVEGYYFIKKELHDYLSPSNPLFQPDRRVNTAGGRVVRRFSPSLTVTGELAVQRAVEHAGTSQGAAGGYAHVKRTFSRAWKPYVKAGYWVMSGTWDPLFSRAPTWGDLHLYSEMNEKSVGYISNLKMVQSEAGFAPLKAVQCRFLWQHLGAFRPSRGSAAIYGSGLARGDSLQARADFTLNRNWRGHAEIETMLPGSFYSARDSAYFLRFEMIYQFTAALSGSRARP